jgi:hypothetical protein
MSRGTGRCGRGTRPPGPRLADSLNALRGRISDLSQGGGRQVRQLHVLEVGPQVFHRVQLGSVGGQPLGGEPGALAIQPGAHPGAPVRGQPIPQQDHLVAGIEASQLLQHRDEAVGVGAGLLQVEAEPGGGGVWPIAQGGRHRGLLPPEPMPQHRRLAAWRPGAPHRWDQRDGRFVEDDDPGRFCGCPFLIRGHSCATQRAIASSSRSLARRSGRCSVQPSRRRRITQTCPG